MPPRHTSGSSSGTRVPTEGRARQGPATVADEAGCSASGVRSQLAPTRPLDEVLDLARADGLVAATPV